MAEEYIPPSPIDPITLLVDTARETPEQRLRRMAEKRKRKKLEKRAAVSEKLTLKDLELSLRQARGIILDAANILGTSRQVLRRIIRNTPHLQMVLKDVKEEVLDLAESRLLEQVDSGNMSAISMVLKTIGRERGYVEKNTVEHEIGEGTIRNAAALIDAMRRGARGAIELDTVEVQDFSWIEEKSPQET